MKSAFVPILKSRQGDTSDKNNYRPIAIVTAISKILELCLMNLIESHLITRDNQFGFKKKHSTDLCIFTVKSVIKYYNLYNSPVYIRCNHHSMLTDTVKVGVLYTAFLLHCISCLMLTPFKFVYCYNSSKQTYYCLLKTKIINNDLYVHYRISVTILFQLYRFLYL